MPKSSSRNKASAKGSSSSQACVIHQTRCGSGGQGCMITEQQAFDYFSSRKEWMGPPQAEPLDISSDEHANWRYFYMESWRKLTCPCGRGYYCRPHGKWIPGENLPDQNCRDLDQLGLDFKCEEDPSYHAYAEEPTVYDDSPEFGHTAGYQDYGECENEETYEAEAVDGSHTGASLSNTMHGSEDSWSYNGKQFESGVSYTNDSKPVALPHRLAAVQTTVDDSDSGFGEMEDQHFAEQTWVTGTSDEPIKKGHSHHKRRSRK